MVNETQLHRYKKLLQFIEEHFKDEINIAEIEEVCNYSYRNINRIFEAINHETIGKYIRRIRLEKAAQYLKYSEQSVSEIAYQVGFGDVAAFSKAFKNRYNCSPSVMRTSGEFIQQVNRSIINNSFANESVNVPFKIETLPQFQALGYVYKGSYEDFEAINNIWQQLHDYGQKNNLLDDHTIYFAEILDDEEITDQINCRYVSAFILDDQSDFEPEGFFIRKTIESRKYAKFIHQGSHKSCIETYRKIYSYWSIETQQEMEDAPVLEFYLNDEKNTPTEELITEIYIPIK